MGIETIFELFGGLALFIYGMHQLGEGLQKSAGDKMRSILSLLTGTTVRAVIVGALVTVIVQSSSATTVMVVGFVSAGLMTLPQAVGVIMGANIGTTLTAWIVAAKVDDYAWIFVAVGFILMFFIKKTKVRYIGQIIFSFGVLFVGLNSMGDAMRPLAQSQGFADMMLRIKDMPVVGMIVGTLATIAVQSSSAAVGVLQTLSSTAVDDLGTPLISMYQAVPILLGSNIGTTVTAVLAALGGGRNAKRAATAHALFNVIGSVVMMFLIRPFVWLVNNVIGLIGHEMIADSNLSIPGMLTPVAEYMRESIAISHTLFNTVNTLIWLPLVWLMVRLIRIIVPGEDPVVEKKLVYIDYQVIKNASISVDLATKELARMTEIAMQMTKDSHEVLKNHTNELETRIFKNEDTLDYLEDEVVKYLSNIFRTASLTESDSSRIAGLMHATNDIERIGDHCSNICDTSLQMHNAGLSFSEIAVNELDEAFQLVETMVEGSIQALRNTDLVMAGKIISLENEMDKKEQKMRESHMNRLNEGKCDPRTTVIFLEIIHTMERISDHCHNIAEFVTSADKYQVHQSPGRAGITPRRES